MSTRRGMTLVELVVAAGLLSILLVALLALMDDFLALWEKGEVRRATVEESAGVVELLATDLAGLEPGPRGDLLAEWAFFDTDGLDGHGRPRPAKRPAGQQRVAPRMGFLLGRNLGWNATA